MIVKFMGSMDISGVSQTTEDTQMRKRRGFRIKEFERYFERKNWRVKSID